MDFSNISHEECLHHIDQRIAERKPGYAIVPSVNHLCQYTRDDRLMRACRESTLVLGGSTPIVWASRLLGTPIREKFNGTDLVVSLCRRAAAEGHSVYFLGASDGVAKEASRVLSRQCPGLPIAGCYSPPRSFEHDHELCEDVLQRVRAANPDICFVALGCPKQELWMQKNYKASGVPFMIGIGDSLELVAGRARRAPRFIRDSGLEWAWRLAGHPRCLAKRYLVENALFFSLFWNSFRRKRNEGLL
jgi:N-acetylglucosaminyldiphosphoundecaprenol N-acetyl-beta-D-mannosaminyltransferase